MRYRLWGSLLFLPFLTAALITLGCSNDKGTDKPKPGPSRTDGKPSGTTASSSELIAIKPAGFATIKGKVTYAGDPPPRRDIMIPDSNQNKSECLKGDHKDPTWIVGPDKGVKFAVVWLRAPKGKYFDVPADQQKPADMMKKIDQPFCAFEPHVQVVFPSFYDEATKKQKKTGQALEVVNSASFAHNTKWEPKETLLDSGGNVQLASKQTLPIDVFKTAPASRKGMEQRFELKCNIHQWMTGYVWAFDHPYAAVTGDDGTFEIKNVPAGTPLTIVAWHEPDIYLGKGPGGETIELKPNEVKTIDFTASK